MEAVTKRGRVCLHCGAPVQFKDRTIEFCCTGCQFVHGLILKHGLGQFYDLQDAALPPAPSTVFQPRDYVWLEQLARIDPKTPLTFDLQGISCVGCVWLIERVFHQQPGALSIAIDTASGRMTLRTEPPFDHVGFARELQLFGYLVGPSTGRERPASRGLMVRVGVCAALAMNAMLFTLPSYLGMGADDAFARLFATVAFICGTLSFVIGGSYFIRRAWHSIRRGVLHIDLPIALGLIAAWTGSVIAWQSKQAGFVYFDFVSMFTFLMLGGRWLQQKAAEANRARLLAAAPDIVRPDTGDRYEVLAGGTVPVRSLLLESDASISLEWINGETEAQTIRAGQSVAAGAINLGSAPIELEALEPWSSSLLSRLVEHARSEVPRNPKLERFLKYYLLTVLALAAVVSGSWFAITGDVFISLQVLTSILVVSCPCAAGVAIPLADDLAAAQARKAGVFVRESTIWQRLAQIRRVVFDKTGTLTLQGAELRETEAIDALNEEDRTVLLAMVRRNHHPVSAALREALMARGTGTVSLDGEVSEHVGEGLDVEHEGHCWSLGKAAWIGAGSKADCVFARDGEVLAEFNFREGVRGDAKEAIADFETRGIPVHILSGDRQTKVTHFTAALGLAPAQGLGALSPDEKADWLRRNDGSHTLMIGDGANDSLAFNEALCTGTPAIDRGLLEHKADFYFMGRSLAGLRVLFAAADARSRAVRGVVTFGIVYNAGAIAMSAAGKMSPLLAAVLMPLSSLVTIGIVLVILKRTAHR